MTITTHAVVGFNDDYGQSYVYGPEEPGAAEGSTWSFDVDVLNDVWMAHEAAEKAYDDARAALFRSVGYDPDEGRMVKPCESWTGDRSPEHTYPDTWTLVLPGHDTEWPRVDHTIAHFDSSEALDRFVTDLPDTFLISPQNTAQVARWVAVDDLRTVKRPGWTTPARADRCERCGWDEDDHGAPT